MKFIPTGLRWRRMTLETNGMPEHLLSWKAERRLDLILRAWENTPYVPNGQVKGMAVDCVRFLAAVLDELYRKSPTKVPVKAHDMAFNNRRGAMTAMKEFLRLYPYHRRIRDNWVEPGDVIVSGPMGGGPGHAIIVGPQENTVWQASGLGIHFTGLASMPATYRVFAVYRMLDRELWA